MKKGFTLIELLIVIAIIAILASVVLATYPNARNKAHDSRVVSAISQARTVMTLAYDQDGNYDTFANACSSGNKYQSDMKAICDDIANNAGDKSFPTIEIDPASNSTSCRIYSKLNITQGSVPVYYCADSFGNAGTIATTTSPLPHGSNGGASCPDGLK